jgi:hypothetical protein
MLHYIYYSVICINCIQLISCVVDVIESYRCLTEDYCLESPFKIRYGEFDCFLPWIQCDEELGFVLNVRYSNDMPWTLC